MRIKGVLYTKCYSCCTHRGILQMALCYLEAIHAQVPKLVRKEKMGLGAQEELDLLEKSVEGDVEEGAVSCLCHG